MLTLANLPLLLQEVRRDFGGKRIWLTEYGYQTNPPDRFGVSTARQSQYVSEAALRARSASLVDVLIHFMVRDEPAVSGWQSGFLTRYGALKPAFFGYMLPIAQVSRRGSRTTIWGQVRPGLGRQVYNLQRLVRGRWATVAGYRRTSSRASYVRVVNAVRGARFRVYSPANKAASRVLTIR